MNADPEYQAKRLEHLKVLNANPEFQAKRLERLKQLHEQTSIRVSVLDTLSNETKVYLSISDAAQAIGCVEGTIRSALKNQKETGVLKPVKKKRYIVQILD